MTMKRKKIKESCKYLIKNHKVYRKNFDKLLENEKKWVLEYFCSGKGFIPYEAIRCWEDLDNVPENEFFARTEFYSSLKNETIYTEEYENVKKLWLLMRFQKFPDLNDLYNFQDTIILYEIFENMAGKCRKNFRTIHENVHLPVHSAAVSTDICLKL